MNGREKTDTAPLADIFNGPKSALKVRRPDQIQIFTAQRISAHHVCVWISIIMLLHSNIMHIIYNNVKHASSENSVMYVYVYIPSTHPAVLPHTYLMALISQN